MTKKLVCAWCSGDLDELDLESEHIRAVCKPSFPSFSQFLSCKNM